MPSMSFTLGTRVWEDSAAWGRGNGRPGCGWVLQEWRVRPGNLQETQVVSVHSGCCNRILCTGAYTTETYFSLFWQVWFLVRAVLLLYRWLPSSCVLTWPLVCVCVCVWTEREREGGRKRMGRREALWCFFQWGHYSYDGALSLWPHLMLITSLEALSPNTATLGVGTSTYEFWGGHTHSVHNTVYSHYFPPSLWGPWLSWIFPFSNLLILNFFMNTQHSTIGQRCLMTVANGRGGGRLCLWKKSWEFCTPLI